MMVNANRVGITIAEHSTSASNNSEVEKYLKNSKLLEEKPKLIRLDVMQESADEARLIEGIKHLISE
jgi:succinylarginine dihydrolase